MSMKGCLKCGWGQQRRKSKTTAGQARSQERKRLNRDGNREDLKATACLLGVTTAEVAARRMRATGEAVSAMQAERRRLFAANKVYGGGYY